MFREWGKSETKGATGKLSTLILQVCTNMNKCHCNFEWTGNDCSSESTITSTTPAVITITQDPSIKMERKETPYGKHAKIQNLSSALLI